MKVIHNFNKPDLSQSIPNLDLRLKPESRCNYPSILNRASVRSISLYVQRNGVSFYFGRFLSPPEEGENGVDFTNYGSRRMSPLSLETMGYYHAYCMRGNKVSNLEASGKIREVQACVRRHLRKYEFDGILRDSELLFRLKYTEFRDVGTFKITYTIS